ncbi:MAG: glycosyltransferase family 4 protein [Clostridia bacterium]|nr:glycosyltransferase family 4 protein [Clostridia bacterium]
MSKIKVIEVSSDTNIGGAGKCLITLLENFNYNDFDVSVILPENSLLKPHIDKLGIKVIEVNGIADKSLDFKAVKALREIFKREKPDIVHTHASMSARIAAKQAGCKVVYTRHSVFPPSKKISRGIGKLINGAINNHYADAIIAVAEAAKENLTDTGVKASKIEVVLNGVDGLAPVSSDEKRIIKERFNLPEGFKAVSIVARLEDIKGHDYFIEAADKLLRKGYMARFYIAGTGSYERHLKEKVKAMHREEQIIFTGFITDVDKLMAITDVQANASYGTEATSLALLEGMSLGIPAVVSDFGGNPGVIKNCVNGYVVPKQNADELAKKLAILLDNEDIYAEMSRGAKRVFAETFTSKAMTRKTEQVYRSLMK